MDEIDNESYNLKYAYGENSVKVKNNSERLSVMANYSTYNSREVNFTSPSTRSRVSYKRAR